MQIKISTLNIAGYKNWNDRQAKIVSFINQESPDVLLMQEVKYDAQYSPYTQAQYINSLLFQPYPHSQTSVSRYYQPPAGKAYREGLAVLSKHPIVESETLVLSKANDDNHTRIAQAIDISVGDTTVKLANIHLSNNYHSDEQLAELLSIYKDRGEARIIAGDYNIFDITQQAQLFAADYTASVNFKGYVSFPAEQATFDYILLPKAYTFNELHVTENLSDHNAITAVITTR